MKLHFVSALCVLLVSVTWGDRIANAQATADTAEAHLALAKAAAKQDFTALFDTLCSEGGSPANPSAAAPAPPSTPPASEWHAEPAKVFDNLYYVGSKPVSAWAVTTSAGIILIDALYEYSVEDEIVNGLKKLGLDPAKIKYVIVTHGHADHYAGAKYLQDHFGAHVVMSAGDWDFMERGPGQNKPRRDMVATDGQKLTLGDTTLTLYVTPGHTPGTLSLLIPAKDGGQRHLAALWGGTAFNFRRTPEAFRIYSNSAQRFHDIVARAPVDIILSNHPRFDTTMEKIGAFPMRKPSAPHPFVVGNESVRRYLQVAGECAKVNLLRMTSPAKP